MACSSKRDWVLLNNVLFSPFLSDKSSELTFIRRVADSRDIVWAGLGPLPPTPKRRCDGLGGALLLEGGGAEEVCACLGGGAHYGGQLGQRARHCRGLG